MELNRREKMELNAESVAYAIELANRLRRDKGQVLLRDKLPYSQYVGIAGECVLARAFNFDCEIAPFDYFGLKLSDFDNVICDHGLWVVRFEDKSVAQILADALGEDIIEIPSVDTEREEVSYTGKRDGCYVVLPREISNIAEVFDSQRELVEKYMEEPTLNQIRGLE